MKTNQFFSEVRNNYVDEADMCTYIDAWFTSDDDENEQSVAVIDKDGKVTVKEPVMAHYTNVIETIVEAALRQQAEKHRAMVASIAEQINKETLKQIEAARCYIGDDIACICDEDLMEYAKESYKAADDPVAAIAKAIELIKKQDDDKTILY